MLALSRKPGERILIPEFNLSISVSEIHANRVVIAIDAPKDVGVYREEVWAKVCDRINDGSLELPTAPRSRDSGPGPEVLETP